MVALAPVHEGMGELLLESMKNGPPHSFVCSRLCSKLLSLYSDQDRIAVPEQLNGSHKEGTTVSSHGLQLPGGQGDHPSLI